MKKTDYLAVDDRLQSGGGAHHEEDAGSASAARDDEDEEKTGRKAGESGREGRVQERRA